MNDPKEELNLKQLNNRKEVPGSLCWNRFNLSSSSTVSYLSLSPSLLSRICTLDF